MQTFCCMFLNNKVQQSAAFFPLFSDLEEISSNLPTFVVVVEVLDITMTITLHLSALCAVTLVN